MEHLSKVVRGWRMWKLHAKGYKNISKYCVIERGVMLDKIKPSGIHIGEGGHLVGGVVGRVVDVHQYIARRRTVLVVGTKDILADDHAVVAGDAGGLGGCVVRAADVHRDVAAYVGSIVGIAQTAAVDAFIHPAAFDGDGGRLVARGSTHSG